MNIRLIAPLLLLALPLRADEITAISRDKKVAVVVVDKGKVDHPQIWTLHPWKRRNLVAVDWGKVSSSPALSSGGSFMAWGCQDGTLRVFDARNGRLLARLGTAFSGGGKFPYAVGLVALSPDGRTLASVNSKGVFVWNWRQRKLLFSRQLRHHMYYDPDKISKLQQPYALVFSPDGKQVAVAGKTYGDENGHVFLLNISKRRFQRIWDINAGDSGPAALAFSPGGNRLLVVGGWSVSASSCDQADLFDTRSGRTLWHVDNGVDMGGGLDSTSRDPDYAAFSSDGRRVALGGLGSVGWGDSFLEIRRASNGKLLSLRTDKAEQPSLETQKRLRPELGVG